MIFFHVTRDNFYAYCCRYGMFDESIFNVTLKIRITMLQVLKADKKTCNMSQVVLYAIALKIVVEISAYFAIGLVCVRA